MLEGGYQYRDLNSTAGTVLRRGTEESFIKQVVLREGDELLLGRTNNVVRVVKMSPDPIDVREKSITVMHVGEDQLGPPERIFANDSKALRTIVQFDSRIMDSSITTDRQVLSELVHRVPELFDGLEYAAIIEEKDEGIRPYDYVILQQKAHVRVSRNIISNASKLKRPFLFQISQEGTLRTEGEEVPLSRTSRLVKIGVPDETTGICAPIRAGHAETRYLQIERQQRHGRLTNPDLSMVNTIVTRVAYRIENLELVRQNQLLNVNASLGVFAAMIGHDIKNYLFFGKRLSDIRDDPLSKHVGILRGIERARKLAQGMKELAAPGHIRVKTFSLEEMAQSIASEFSSIFGDCCRFEVEAETGIACITTSEELLSRVVWNLVMNAYHTAENRRSRLPEPPWVRIIIREAGAGKVAIEVQDNAGGIGSRTLEYMQRSFALIKQVYTQEKELLNVVDTISRMEGFTNSVGLFFIAVAVKDMRGDITVTTTQRKGSVFRIELPEQIAELKRLVRF